jgi:hypothetical protein
MYLADGFSPTLSAASGFRPTNSGQSSSRLLTQPAGSTIATVSTPVQSRIPQTVPITSLPRKHLQLPSSKSSAPADISIFLTKEGVLRTLENFCIQIEKVPVASFYDHHESPDNTYIDRSSIKAVAWLRLSDISARSVILQIHHLMNSRRWSMT